MQKRNQKNSNWLSLFIRMENTGNKRNNNLNRFEKKKQLCFFIFITRFSVILYN